MSYRAKTIAYAFVKRGIDEGIPVTQMKLQKMVYVAHGIHLALYSEPLIKEHFQAWKYGPVVRDIYSSYKFYGSKPIYHTDWLFSQESMIANELNTLDTKATKTIDTTWDALKTLNAGQLSNWTHKDESPWAQVYVEGVNDIVIPNEVIGNYFKQWVIE